ncbi:hypothetical protein AWB70_04691 [Caballeronia cordobensis]|uniref:Uncharacterized protein n=1 Tax=Caballeronia cordobensis TaxID=1353886 RepID=A0A158IEI0_CABCO|nr:hypothetical protein [Caballeronia cordobensis]SAL55022.1 hypothetical protein AWB70_04691 [Caballeronia cordobensis]
MTTRTSRMGASPETPPGVSVSPTAAVPPIAPLESSETVTVACRLPQGVHLDIVKHGELRKRVTLNGANSRDAVAGFGITEHVPKAFFEQWLADHQESPAVKNGLIFAHKRKASVEAQAEDNTDLKSGLDPMNPKKPGKDLLPLSKE